MIKLTKLCNKRRIEDERTPLENDFSSGCEFSFGKSYAPGLAMCGSHTSLRSSVSSHPSLGSAQRVSLIDYVYRLCEYSRNENLSTQDHRILVIKKQTSKNDFGPAEAEGRSQTRPVEFLGVYFFILVFMTIRALNFILLFVPQLVQHN